jgi:hypothetical protein
LRPFPIVSISDGTNLPAIFAYSDVLLESQDSSFRPSPVTEINNENVTHYLTRISQIGQLQDRDALWNSVFYSIPQVSLDTLGTGLGLFSGGGLGGVEYPGSNTTIKFGNGTSRVIYNYARVERDFSGVSSGLDAYAKWFQVKDDMSIDLQHGTNLADDPRYEKPPRFPESSCAKKNDRAADYPRPVLPTAVQIMKTKEAGGYYLDQYGHGYEDIAVLSVYSFVNFGEVGKVGNQQEWQNVTRKFLCKAKADGKKKLVIDLSANRGGTVLLAYDLFAQLFPAIEPYGGSRFRAHQAWDEMGKMDSVISANIPRTMSTGGLSDWVVQPMNYRSDLDKSGKPFTSWAQKYGPHRAHGDWHTTTQRWNLDDPMAEYFSKVKKLTGHGLPKLNLGWKPEDMVLLYDGYCGSSCAIFSELMRRQAGVKAIAMGGRPNKDIIQAVGGTKGSHNWQWKDVLWFVLSMHEKANSTLKERWAGKELGKFNTFLPLRVASETSPGLNMRDGVQSCGDATPLQFVVEPADCRLFYTPKMVVDLAEMWKVAVDAKWLGKRRCVAGDFT